MWQAHARLSWTALIFDQFRNGSRSHELFAKGFLQSKFKTSGFYKVN